MRVAILWNTLTGYLNGALKALASMPGTEIFVADHLGATKQAPFAEALFSWIPAENRFSHDGVPDAVELLRRVEAFAPDVLYVASWSNPSYVKVCRAFRGRALRVSGMDNQWRGTPKQWLGVVTAPVFVRRIFDCIMVAGERQRRLADMLGYDRDHIWTGMLCPDYDSFQQARLPEGVVRPHRFLFASRLVHDKGLDVLAEAYRRYRAAVADPWPLDIAGNGALEEMIRAVPGVTFHGFVQPDKLPALFAQAGCFLLPSVVEPWGVVLQEAAVAGLPVICTDECGASVHYLVDGYNGYIVQNGSVESLTRALIHMGSLSAEESIRMSKASLAIGEQMTPTRWATHFLEKSAACLEDIRKPS